MPTAISWKVVLLCLLAAFGLLLVGSLPAYPVSAENSNTNSPFFKDTSTHWGTEDIAQLKEECNVLGYTDAQGKLTYEFRPNNLITRAELVTMVTKCKYGELTTPPATKKFSDVSTSHWAAAYIAKAAEIGSVSGYSNGTFKPDNTATRAEAIKIILLTWYNPDQLNATLSNDCTDIFSGQWYFNYFNYGLSHDIISGYLNPDGTPTGFCKPGNQVTRGEAAKMIVHTKGLINF